MSDEVFRILQRLAQIDERFLHEGLADHEATLQLYGFKLTPEQMHTVAEYKEKLAGMTDEQIVLELRKNLSLMKP
ncbi:MAG TPA: hypothetical protein VN973_04950 [Candidatus Dormibacteraeota bacterium]|nr:hypothetical protein [Candidatus Dormibacteraeota bacterium]